MVVVAPSDRSDSTGDHGDDADQNRHHVNHHSRDRATHEHEPFCRPFLDSELCLINLIYHVLLYILFIVSC